MKVSVFKKVGERPKILGLPMESLLLLMMVFAVSIFAFSILSYFLNLGMKSLLVIVLVMGIIYLVLRAIDKTGRQYFLLSKISRYFMQYRKINMLGAKITVKEKENA